MKSTVTPLNQRHFGLHSMKKPFKNYERLETFKVVFGPAIFACACCMYYKFTVTEIYIKDLHK